MGLPVHGARRGQLQRHGLGGIGCEVWRLVRRSSDNLSAAGARAPRGRGNGQCCSLLAHRVLHATPATSRRPSVLLREVASRDRVSSTDCNPEAHPALRFCSRSIWAARCSGFTLRKRERRHSACPHGPWMNCMTSALEWESGPISPSCARAALGNCVCDGGEPVRRAMHKATQGGQPFPEPLSTFQYDEAAALPFRFSPWLL